MLIKKALYLKHRQAGVSLIELMISIALGLLLLAAGTAMTVSSMVMNADTLSSARLNQDLDSVLQVMVNDLRRAGFSANVTAGAAGVDYANLEDLNIVAASTTVPSSCVLYSYNVNGDGVKDNDEKYGFKLAGANGDEIHMRTTCTSGNCSIDCTAGTWVALTDPDVVSISSLTFNAGNSKCLNITSKNFWVINPNVDINTKFPCEETIVSKLTNYVLTSGVYGTGTFVAPVTGSGDRLVESRQVNIQITGNLTGDPSVTKSQKVAINVRNNHASVK